MPADEVAAHGSQVRSQAKDCCLGMVWVREMVGSYNQCKDGAACFWSAYTGGSDDSVLHACHMVAINSLGARFLI